jgi:hypothetical protein
VKASKEERSRLTTLDFDELARILSSLPYLHCTSSAPGTIDDPFGWDFKWVLYDPKNEGLLINNEYTYYLVVRMRE